MPKYLRLAEFSVAACTPRTELLALSTFLDKTYVAPQPDPSGWQVLPQVLLDACADFQPDHLLACDEVSVRALDRLYEMVRDSSEGLSLRVKQLLHDSKGDPANYRLVRNKHLSCALMRNLGFRVPEQITCRDYRELSSAVSRLAYPLVLKGEHGVGGQGVSICRSDDMLAPAWDKARKYGTVAIQQYIAGTVFFSTAAAYRGRFLTANVFERVMCNPANTGPSTVVHCCDQPEIILATRRFVEQTGYSGILSLDFIRSMDKQVFFLECNPRAVSSTHLGHLVGNDLFAALSAAMTGREYRQGLAREMTIALFPTEAIRDPQSAYLQNAHHDVPWDEPLLVRASMDWAMQQDWRHSRQGDASSIESRNQ